MNTYMNYSFDTEDPIVRQKLIQENVSKNKIRKRIMVKRMDIGGGGGGGGDDDDKETNESQ